MKNLMNQIMNEVPRGLMDVLAILVLICFVFCVAKYLHLKSRRAA